MTATTTTMIRTGCEALDKLLGGGVRAGMLTDIFGPSGTGKTQICFQLCVNCVMPKQKGSTASALFVDSTNTFRPERISQMGEHAGADDKLLDRIYVSKVYNTGEEKAVMGRFSAIPDLKLVVIDSVADLFALEYKRSMGAEKHLGFMKFLRELAFKAVKCNIAVVVTNGVRFAGTEQIQHLDRSVSSFAHYKIQLAKQDDVFKALLLQPALPPSEAFFRISDRGITDL